MNFKRIKENNVLKILTNSYIVILIIFLSWMLFFDENTHLNREFNREIKELNNTVNFYKKEIKRDQLQDSLQLERFAREKYLMKKENEDVYIIEFDIVK